MILTSIKGGLVVSCQALENEPLHSSFIMGRMALAAKEGGAVGIRANTAADIKEIKKNVALPIIGIVKRDYIDSPIYITATMKEVEELVAVGVDIIATDATNRPRPNGDNLVSFVNMVKEKWPNQIMMADIATLSEAVFAEKIGFDCVGTTLHGYTEETAGQKLYTNDFAFLRAVLAAVKCPVIAEGNVMEPQSARRVLDLGAYAVVVGGAITRPQQITARFCAALNA